MPPLRSQRILILAGLALPAWLLHTSACEWAWKRQLMYGRQTTSSLILRLWTHAPAADSIPLGTPATNVPMAVRRNTTPSPYGPPITALYSQSGVDRLTAIIAGVIVPLALLGVTIYLLLGWRCQSRRVRGLCPTCGYDLRAQRQNAQGAVASARCPECGSQ